MVFAMKNLNQICAKKPGLAVRTRVKMGPLGEVLTCDPELENYTGIYQTWWKKLCFIEVFSTGGAVSTRQRVPIMTTTSGLTPFSMFN